MAGEQLNLEFLVKVINDTKAGMDSVIAEYKRLGDATAAASKKGDTIGGTQQQQRMSGLHTRITQLTGAFRKLGIELETIDLYFISGFKVVALFKLLEFAKESVLAFENYRKGIIGIQLAAEQSSQTMEDSMTAFNNLLKMGKIGAVDLAESVRNLLKRGMNTADVEKVIKVLTMSGTVFGTQHGVPLGEAVKRSTEGLLLEISNLVDATRLTKNLKDVFEDFGKTIGKTGDSLNQYEKNLAIVSWMTQENIGLAEKYAIANVGVTAALSEFAVEFDRIKRGVGEGLSVPVTLTVKGAKETLSGIDKILSIAAKEQSIIGMVATAPLTISLSAFRAFSKQLNRELTDTAFPEEDKPFVKLFKAAKSELNSYKLDFQNLIQKTFGDESIITKMLGFKKIVDSVFASSEVRTRGEKYVRPVSAKYMDFDFPKEFSTTMAEIETFNKGFWSDTKIEEYNKKLVTLTDAAGKSALVTLKQEEKYVDNINNMLTLVSETADKIFMEMDNLAEKAKNWVDAPGNMIDLVNEEYGKISESIDKRTIGGKLFTEEEATAAREAGKKIAQAFSYPIERGVSDVFFGLFTGQKKSFAEMARNFGLAMGRAISDALAEALMMPVKKIMTSMFTSMAGSVAGGSLATLFTAKPALPVTAVPDTITINSPITVHANDTNSFAKTLKQTSKLAAGLMVKEMRKSRNIEKQFRRK